jgi:hypothetical protein
VIFKIVIAGLSVFGGVIFGLLWHTWIERKFQSQFAAVKLRCEQCGRVGAKTRVQADFGFDAEPHSATFCDDCQAARDDYYAELDADLSKDVF